MSKAESPALLLADTWNAELNCNGWWLSEKLDGVRAYWDGSRFVSRNGNEFHAPEWYRAAMPAEALDGELWIGRKQFQKTMGIVRRDNGGDAWKSVRYMVFDAPCAAGTFEHRLDSARAAVAACDRSAATVLDHVKIASTLEIESELTRVIGLGGEGVMLRRPGSRYEGRRSVTLLKAKRFLDSEATVAGFVPGIGRHEGRCGALVVVMRNGVRFSVGSGMTDVDRDFPPAIGSVVTFRYQELSSDGVPRFPTFVGTRTDIAV